MARATEGFPFLVQLVGYHVWNECRTDEIVLDDVRRGVEIARRKLGTTVHALSIRDLSEKDRAFLVGMTVDDGPSRLSDVASRMGATAKFASVYRARLIESGMVEPAGHGLVTFAPPYLRDYLREHQDTLVG
jgi:hypothetical protein